MQPKKILILTILGVLMAGCGATLKPVPDKFRATTTAFDGIWSGSGKITNKFQREGGYEYTCIAYEVQIEINISAGIVYGKTVYENGSIEVFTTNIDDNGYFLGVVYTDRTYRGSTRPANRVRRMYNVYLNNAMNTGVGELIISVGNRAQGCRGEIELDRKS